MWVLLIVFFSSLQKGFYFVTKGWIFNIGSCEKSINQGPPAAAVSIKLQLLYPQAMINSRAERVRLVNKDLRKGKPPGVHHPIWDHFSGYVTEAYNCFSVCLLRDRL